MSEIWLIRHGETAWSLSGQHTGRTNLPLTPKGRERAEVLRRVLAGRQFALVLVSPLARAIETCTLAGFGGVAQVDPDLAEWDYGDYEGRTSEDIQRDVPGWSIWEEGPKNGETVDQVGARADRAIARAAAAAGDVALFAHGHLLRILAARWLTLPPAGGRFLALSTGSISTLGYERGTRVITSWNLSPSA